MKMALLCGSTSVTPFLSHKNVVVTTTSSKSSFVGFQLPLPKLTLSSSVRSLLPSTSRVRSQQDSTAPVVEDPCFLCVEPEPRFKGPELSMVAVTSRLFCSAQNLSSGHRISVRCKAVGENRQASLDETIIYEGIYGPWTVGDSDVQEVILYRSGLVTAAASFVVAASVAFLPDSSLSATLKQNVDLFYVLGSGGLGLSLFLIHIYVTEIKRTLQALWGLGVLGSAAAYFALAQPANKNLMQYVIDNPSTVWLVGPLFAALTGLVFKEGLCYGKLEAGLLTFVIPIVLLGHMTGLMDDGVKLTLLASWMTLFVIFAGRKFTQPIKDDIGDKSVFMFNSLRDDERKALLEKLEQQKTQN